MPNKFLHDKKILTDISLVVTVKFLLLYENNIDKF